MRGSRSMRRTHPGSTFPTHASKEHRHDGARDRHLRARRCREVGAGRRAGRAPGRTGPRPPLPRPGADPAAPRPCRRPGARAACQDALWPPRLDRQGLLARLRQPADVAAPRAMDQAGRAGGRHRARLVGSRRRPSTVSALHSGARRRPSAVCCPTPDIEVVLSGSPAVLLARKDELPADEIERQTAAWQALRPAGPRVLHLDAARPIADLTDAVMDRLADQRAGVFDAGRRDAQAGSTCRPERRVHAGRSRAARGAWPPPGCASTTR